MEKIIMKREWLGEGIPVLNWKGVQLIQIEEGTYMTAKPIGKNMRTMEIANRMVSRFAERFNSKVSLTNEEEWKKAVSALKKFDFAAKEFSEINELCSDEVLLLNSNDETTHVLAAGNSHELDEIFNGFISDYDAKGVKQPHKSIFATIKFEDKLIEVS